MSVTMAEFTQNPQKFIYLSETEDIFITENGRFVARLSKPYQTKRDMIDSLIGILPQTMTYEEAMAERLKEL